MIKVEESKNKMDREGELYMLPSSMADIATSE